MGTGLGTWGAALGNKGSLRLTHGATVGRNAQPVNGSLAMVSRALALWRAGLGRREAQNKLVARLTTSRRQPRIFWADALRYLVGTKSRTIIQRKLRGCEAMGTDNPLPGVTSKQRDW